MHSAQQLTSTQRKVKLLSGQDLTAHAWKVVSRSCLGSRDFAYQALQKLRLKKGRPGAQANLGMHSLVYQGSSCRSMHVLGSIVLIIF